MPGVHAAAAWTDRKGVRPLADDAGGGSPGGDGAEDAVTHQDQDSLVRSTDRCLPPAQPMAMRRGSAGRSA
ncbi:hypothetical protein SHJG_p1122 (plasmid) [Streptomyces hygroscopicus subsp. jinggangensis 5008]|nr:hypothetical protein SHJG_p1122 [Streptomyces hygroscopicus subsp. jinggangensis 5008]AGF68407.1 hypothetical protein SHJGH_p1122 [Streptomyces hygroscopicus subsp. jinggangensis TL01]